MAIHEALPDILSELMAASILQKVKPLIALLSTPKCDIQMGA